MPGAHTGGATPVPIPNTAVKPSRADGTASARGWESRSVPGFFICTIQIATDVKQISTKTAVIFFSGNLQGESEAKSFFFDNPVSRASRGTESLLKTEYFLISAYALSVCG